MSPALPLPALVRCSLLRFFYVRMVYRRYGKRYRRRLGRSRRKVRMSKSLYKRRRYRRYRRRARKSQGLTVSGNRESCLEESSFIPLAKLTKGSYVGALNDNFYMWSINPLPAGVAEQPGFTSYVGEWSAEGPKLWLGPSEVRSGTVNVQDTYVAIHYDHSQYHPQSMPLQYQQD